VPPRNGRKRNDGAGQRKYKEIEKKKNTKKKKKKKRKKRKRKKRKKKKEKKIQNSRPMPHQYLGYHSE